MAPFRDVATGGWNISLSQYDAVNDGLVAKPKNKIAAVHTRLMRLPLQIVHCRAETALRVPADCLLLNARSRNCELLQH
jgi:hypothetical protein